VLPLLGLPFAFSVFCGLSTKVESRKFLRVNKDEVFLGLSSQVLPFSSLNVLVVVTSGFEVVQKNLHSFDRIHVATGINVYGTSSILWERVDADMRFGECIDNRYTLR
jgi:hypothetical protein